MLNNYDNNRFYTLKAIVMSLLSAEERGTELYNKYLNFAAEGLRGLNLNFGVQEVKTYKGKMTSFKTMNWPKDMVDYTKVGVVCGDLVKVLVQDDSINMHFDQDEEKLNIENASCDHINLLPIDSEVYFYNSDHYGYKFYGIPVHNNGVGYYRADYSGRQFIFRDTVDKNQEILIEYITDGLNYEDDSVVHPYLYDPIRSYVMWQSVEFNERVPESTKDRRQRNFNRSVGQMQLNFLKASSTDIRDWLRSGKTLVVQD